MKKILIILLTFFSLNIFAQVDASYVQQLIKKSKLNDTIVGVKIINTATGGIVGWMSISGTDTSYFYHKGDTLIQQFATGTLLKFYENGDSVIIEADDSIFIAKQVMDPAIPGGSNTDVQFNDNGSFAGDDDLTFDGDNLTLGGDLLFQNDVQHDIGSNTNAADTGFIQDILVNTIQELSGSEIAIKVGGIARFKISSTILGTVSSGRGAFRNVVPSATVPTVLPRHTTDNGSGMGYIDNSPNIITGGNEMMRFASDLITFHADLSPGTDGVYNIGSITKAIDTAFIDHGIFNTDVGIGTDNPSVELDVDGAAIFNKSGLDKDFNYTSDTIPNAFHLDGASGFVGIGTSTPNFFIDVNPSAGNANIRAKSETGTADLILDAETGNDSRIFFRLNGASSAFSMGVDATDGFFKIGTAALETNPRLTINTTGDVGIGTINPGTKLDVDGVITATGGTSTEWNTAYDDKINSAAFNSQTGVITLTQQDAGTVTVTAANMRINTTSQSIWSNTTNTYAVGEDGGTNNIILGQEAGNDLTTGDDNIFIGKNTGEKQTTAIGNTIIGKDAGKSNLTGTGLTLIGNSAGADLTGLSNTFIGSNAGFNNTTSEQCIAIGVQALGTAIGTGDFNIGIGNNTGAAMTGGEYNVLLGSSAGDDITTGSGNVMLGNLAGSASGNISNQLHITNTNDVTPLIYGEFDNDLLVVNGDLTVTGVITHSGGICYVSTLGTQTIGTAGQFERLNEGAIAYTAGDLVDFTHDDGRLTYTGTTTRHFIIHATVAIQSGETAQAVNLRVAKGGTSVAGSNMPITFTAQTVDRSTPLLWVTSLATNEYIEIYGTSDTNGDLFDVLTIVLSVTEH